MPKMILRAPSLETRWLQRREKWMAQPSVVVASLDGTGAACCYRPRVGETLIDGRHFDLSHGIIVLDSDYIADDAAGANAVAHEWRHHWQHLSGWVRKPQPVHASMWEAGNYRENIVRYFKQRHEMDALQFSLAVAPSDQELEWVEWIRAKG